MWVLHIHHALEAKTPQVNRSHNFISLGTGLNLTDINEEVSHSVEGGESASEEDLNGDDWVENILWTLSVR